MLSVFASLCGLPGIKCCVVGDFVLSVFAPCVGGLTFSVVL